MAGAATLVTGASVQVDAPANDPTVFESEGMHLSLEEVYKTDGVIWAMAFVDERTMIFTLRDGQLNLLNLEDFSVTPVAGGPEVRVSSSGGLFDVMVDPDFAVTSFVYMTYVKPVDAGTATALARGRLHGSRLTDVVDLFVANNASMESAHWGSRVVMDQDRFLYMTVGDRHIPDNAQKLSSHGGKIIRLHEDGRVPDDNPFIGQADAAPEVWTYGHRNPQGLAVQRASGRLFEQEHGPTGGDEINIVVKGRNYGWPVITYGENIWGGQSAAGTSRQGMEEPIKYWVPGNAPAGMSFYGGNRYPAWRGDLFSTTLRGHVDRLVLDANSVVGEERLMLTPVDRMRDIAEGPDGLLYIATESGRIARFVPVEP